MKVDYIENINEHFDSLIRLYDFDNIQAKGFSDLIVNLIEQKNTLTLSNVPFIQTVNCNLTLQISDKDKGISTGDNKNFVCELTFESYKRMVLLLEPFCKEKQEGYQWLYDLDNPMEFLFSPNGDW